MVDIHVEPHADGVRRHQIVDLARLDTCATWALRVRGLSAPSTTAVPPRWRRIVSASAIDLGTEKATTALRGGRRVSFLWPGIGEASRSAAGRRIRRPGTSLRSSGRMVSAPSSMVSSQPARMEQPVGEDMAALGVGRELDLVDGEEVDRPVERHDLDGADPIARARPAGSSPRR